MLDIVQKRSYSYLSSFIENNKNRENVEYVVSDMWKPYLELFNKYFQNAKFIVDRYHWIRQITWVFESVRKEEQKRLGKMFRLYFQKSKTLLLKRYKYLSVENKHKVDMMLYKSTALLEAHGIKEDFLIIVENIKRIRRAKKAKRIRNLMKKQ